MLVDKPEGPTSHDVVARARRLFREQQPWRLALEPLQEPLGSPAEGDEPLRVEEQRHLAGEGMDGVGILGRALVEGAKDHEGRGSEPLVFRQMLGIQAVLHRQGMKPVLGGHRL